YRKPQKYRNDEHPSINNNNNNNNNNIKTNITTTTTTTTTTSATATNQYLSNDNYLESNRFSSQVSSNSLDLRSVELQQEQQQHYNSNYYYYYNYNLSYAPPPAAPHECLLGGPKGLLQQLRRRTRHELQQWPLLMQLVVLILWLHGKFWQIVHEQILMQRRRWH
ncbi:GATA zinc finger domain-containing protein 11-like, partial [Drosophila grimshawi]|uniref:GATA zinc finger domain-containing protein 11-like n=1 Tax=Drosophila grimshawi TaxID=7222 RepID=UPI0013EF4E82